MLEVLEAMKSMRNAGWVAGAVVAVMTVPALALGDLLPIRVSGWLCIVLATLPAFPGMLRGARAALALTGATVVSAVGTLAVLLVRPYGMMDVRNDGSALLIWCTFEVVALCALSLWAGRLSARAPTLLAVPVMAAAGLIALRLVPDQILDVQLFIAALCASPVAGANILGRYLRAQDRQREQAVHAARLRQQRELALDLHDHVAHEIAAISVAAQAARTVGGEAGLASLEPIETAAARATDKLAQSIEALSETEAGSTETRAPGLADIGSLIARFERQVEFVDDVTDRDEVPGAIQYAAYRVVVEGLNNVRRHAPATPGVTVTLDTESVRDPETMLRVRVRNQPEPHPTGCRPGTGLGLAGLTERVTSQGGTLEAAPDKDGGWSLTARLPIVAQHDEAGGTADRTRGHRR